MIILSDNDILILICSLDVKSKKIPKMALNVYG